jgi:hypothetical protein
MGSFLRVEKSKPTSVKRLSFLPRFGVVIDICGKQFTYRQAPILETLFNLIGKGFTLKGLKEVAFQQLAEIELAKQDTYADIFSPHDAKSPKTKRRVYRPS